MPARVSRRSRSPPFSVNEVQAGVVAALRSQGCRLHLLQASKWQKCGRAHIESSRKLPMASAHLQHQRLRLFSRVEKKKINTVHHCFAGAEECTSLITFHPPVISAVFPPAAVWAVLSRMIRFVPIPSDLLCLYVSLPADAICSRGGSGWRVLRLLICSVFGLFCSCFLLLYWVWLIKQNGGRHEGHGRRQKLTGVVFRCPVFFLTTQFQGGGFRRGLTFRERDGKHLHVLPFWNSEKKPHGGENMLFKRLLANYCRQRLKKIKNKK